MCSNKALVIGPMDLEVDAALALAASSSLLVAVDGGLVHCEKWGILPDIVVGDFDSLQDSVALLAWAAEQGGRIITAPADKDYSDLTLALMECRDMGVQAVDIVGCFGGLLDHQLAVLGSMLMVASVCDVRLLGSQDQVIQLLTRPGEAIQVESGVRFSVIPVQQSAVVSINGAQWDLVHQKLDVLSDWGLSNVAISDQGAQVRLHSGTIIVSQNPVG